MITTGQAYRHGAPVHDCPGTAHKNGRRISGGTEKGENIVMSSHDKEQSHCDAYEKILDLESF